MAAARKPQDRLKAESDTATAGFVTVPLDGNPLRVKGFGKWKKWALPALKQGDFDRWAEGALHPDDVDSFINADVENDDIAAFLEAWTEATGQDLGESSAS